MNSISKLLTIATLMLLVGTILTSCKKTNGTEKPVETLIAVKTSTVTTAPMAATFRSTGTLEGEHEAVVMSETHGRIVSVAVNNGSRVGAGSALVSVDNELKSIAVQQADAGQLAAEATLEKAQLDFGRSDELIKTGAVTKSQLEMAALQVKSAQAQLKTAESMQSLAKRQLSDATVKAPFAGAVAMRYVNLGDLLDPGAKVATVIDDSKMKLKVNINELDLSLIKIGDHVDISVDAIPGKIFAGKIVSIADKADVGRSYMVEVELENPGHELKSGMFARAEIKRETERNCTVAPTQAIIYNGQRTQVYVVDAKNIVHLRGVKTGVTTPEYAEITEGLQPGDVVVSFGQAQLKDGQAVQIQK